MTKYYILTVDLNGDRGIVEDPELPEGVSFRKAEMIEHIFRGALRFRSNCDLANPPSAFLKCTIPVFSTALVNVFRSAGVENFQSFPAMVTDWESTQEWQDYYAINVLKILSRADLGLSTIRILGNNTKAPVEDDSK